MSTYDNWLTHTPEDEEDERLARERAENRRQQARMDALEDPGHQPHNHNYDD